MNVLKDLQYHKPSKLNKAIRKVIFLCNKINKKFSIKSLHKLLVCKSFPTHFQFLRNAMEKHKDVHGSLI